MQNKGCPNLPSIPWRFVTRNRQRRTTPIGHPWVVTRKKWRFVGHVRWAPCKPVTGDPMRKQGSVTFLLGNGGDR